MVHGWAAAGAALRAGLEDAAELAQPDLVRVADRVFEQLDRDRRADARAPEAGLWPRLVELFRRVQAPVALAAAAAAIALVLWPLARPGEDVVASRLPVEASEPSEPTPAVVMNEISFENADGMIFRTRKGGMTVIWVNEFDGA
jgi:hypothetical protein